MSSARKLQTEIDKTLKKIDDGIDTFDEIWDKVYSASTQSQKEKYEGDLKKELKKLQRCREQLKSWVNSSDVKKKDPLLKARRRIEEKMEAFKICEKETKTKAYSKAGLAAAGRLDPKEKAKKKTKAWINECVSKLQFQIEEMEAEIEDIKPKKKKKKMTSTQQEEVEEIEERIGNHRFHIEKLEQILRLLMGSALDVDDVDALQDDVEYYIESYEEEDFFDEELYEPLNLEEHLAGGKREAAQKAQAEEAAARARARAKDEQEQIERERRRKEEEELERRKAAAAAAKEKERLRLIKLEQERERQKRAEKERAAAARVKSSPGPVSFSALLKKSNAEQQQTSTQAKTPPAKALSSKQQKGAERDRQQQEMAEREKQRSMAQEQADQQQLMEKKRQQQAQAQKQQQQQQQQGGAQQQQQQNGTHNLPTTARNAIAAQVANAAQPVVDAPVLPPCFPRLPEDLRLGLSMFTSTHARGRVPQLSDGAVPDAYAPRNPHDTPSVFPSQPEPALKTAALTSRFDLDTLFFIFYYQQGTYEQMLAARELKKRSWRFHTKFFTWFQRHVEPEKTTDDYETGTYLYFDYDHGWCQRIKQHFKFEYIYLEDELPTV